jgi:aminoglycoside phosphotransferase family enzyme
LIVAQDVALKSKVAFLRQPTSYPEPTYRVEAIETHMSWVFLTDGYAYKLKKPVHYDFLDFRRIDARRFYCEEEVRLNRRLAANIYLGIVALNLDPCGHLQLGAVGNAIDWLVKMRRLPTQRMLDYALKHAVAGVQDIDRVAARLADFYLNCPPVSIDAGDYRKRFLLSIDRQKQTLSEPAYQLPIAQINAICAAQGAAIQNMAALFDERIQRGKIIEGHGDLRPEHICLDAAIDVIDCLEFSYDLRIIDPADEIGFLALECERLGYSEFGIALLRRYSEISGDWPANKLVHFYQSFRAMLRAVLAIKHLNEEQFRYSPQWPRRARDYLDLAERHIARCA